MKKQIQYDPPCIQGTDFYHNKTHKEISQIACKNEISLDEILFEMSLSINSQLDLQLVLNKAVKFNREIANSAGASIVLWNSRLRVFEKGASTTPVGDGVSKYVRSSGGASRWILENRKPLLVPDIEFDPFAANQMIAENNIQAYVGVPLIHSDQVLGVVYGLYEENRSFSDSEIAGMKKLAAIVASAIHNAQVVQSLQQLNQFKTAMMRTVAHDLVHPLSLAMGFSQMVAEQVSAQSPEIEKQFEIIKRSHARMNCLISGINAYENMLANSDIKRESVNLNDVAQNVIASLQMEAVKKFHSLSLFPDATEPIIHADYLLIQVVVMHLVENALKYTPEGGTVNVFLESDPDHHVLLVQDSGIGMNSNSIVDIFNPFERLKNSNDVDGAGIGLSLVKMIVEKLNGKMQVESGIGQGSMFKIYFPKYSKQ